MFKKCHQLDYERESTVTVQECFGDSLTNLTNVGKSTLTFLEGQQSQVSGACARAHTDLTGYIKLYTASAQSINRSVDGDEFAGIPATIDNALVALNDARAASLALDATCKPTSAS